MSQNAHLHDVVREGRVVVAVGFELDEEDMGALEGGGVRGNELQGLVRHRLEVWVDVFDEFAETLDVVGFAGLAEGDSLKVAETCAICKSTSEASSNAEGWVEEGSLTLGINPAGNFVGFLEKIRSLVSRIPKHNSAERERTQSLP